MGLQRTHPSPVVRDRETSLRHEAILQGSGKWYSLSNGKV